MDEAVVCERNSFLLILQKQDYCTWCMTKRASAESEKRFSFERKYLAKIGHFGRISLFQPSMSAKKFLSVHFCFWPKSFKGFRGCLFWQKLHPFGRTHTIFHPIFHNISSNIFAIFLTTWRASARPDPGCCHYSRSFFRKISPYGGMKNGVHKMFQKF